MGAGNDDSSFFLYGVGERPDALTLGSLVLEKYWQPIIARHYTHKPLNDQELQKHAYATEAKNIVFHGSSRLSPGVGVDGADIVNLGLAFSKDQDRIVIAEKGTRMILKDPEMFLESQVLPNPEAQKKLKVWLSAANSSFVLNFKFARRPKIWLLTGLYVLEQTRTLVSRSKSTDISAGISSALIGAASGVPIGGSVNLGTGSTWEMAMEVAEPHVWAAQFRLLDARFIKMAKGGLSETKLPTTIGLYRDVLSMSMQRSSEPVPARLVQDSVQLGLESVEAELDKKNETIDQESEELQEYEKRLEQAIKLMEIAPKHLLM
ncbi:Uncharacterized protein PECH_008636 [Penicillium ucsense]|uniref:Uncharacterized protein n=1 Tax=Penicillium ucsense TaxID=2839758 RepID=A0A8J8WJM2_9EURO|nr:Uncharacterized protein PECM_005211 [Penicillium ucsense]KAF7738643.1 Uncharacterized protein PECH_008636 [Penicillium ucsense]